MHKPRLLGHSLLVIIHDLEHIYMALLPFDIPFDSLAQYLDPMRQA
jgi:hypothetical protein